VSSRHAKQEEKEERRRRWRIVKFQKSPLTVSLTYNTSLSVFKTLRKDLECFIDKFKAQKAAFGMHSIREFWKISYYVPLSWFMITCSLLLNSSERTAPISSWLVSVSKVRILFWIVWQNQYGAVVNCCLSSAEPLAHFMSSWIIYAAYSTKIYVQLNKQHVSVS